MSYLKQDHMSPNLVHGPYDLHMKNSTISITLYNYSQQETPPLAMRLINNYSILISSLLLHRTRTLMSTTSSTISNSISNIMDSSSSKASVSFNGGGGSQRLINLAQQLRLYKTPSTTIFDNNNNDDEIEEQRREENEGKVVSQVGFVESSTPPIVSPEKFQPKKAAVLICLFEDDDGILKVILTKRSSKLSTHSGEVSLPGGKAEEGDANDTETAMREAKEEIGLEPSLVNVVTVLEPFLSKHLLRVVPVVGILTDKQLFKPTPNADEVEAIFNAPLEMFLKDENRAYEEREWMGYKYLIHFFDYETENKKFTIWGLTAGILIRAASVVFQRPPSFEEQKPNYRVPKLNHLTTMP